MTRKCWTASPGIPKQPGYKERLSIDTALTQRITQALTQTLPRNQDERNNAATYEG